MANVAPDDRQMGNAERYRKSALWLLGVRGNGIGRLLRLAAFVLVAWSLLAWGAALALVTRAEIGNADVIVVLSNPSAFVERTRHAAQLWKAGRAPRVLITNENLRSSWSEAEQRNPLFTERATEALKSAGVPRDKIEVLPQMVGGTVDEAVLMRQYAQQHELRSILIVTSAYHSRRALWTFRNVFQDSGIAIGLDPVAPGFQTPTPATWWLQPAAWKIVALEYPKLLYYRVKYRSTVVESWGAPSGPGPEVKVVTGTSQSGLTLSVAAPVSAYTDEVVLIDARKSIGVPKKPQLDGTPSVTIDFGDGYTCNLLASGHAYRQAGTYTITVTAKSGSGSAAAPVTTTIQVSDIPAASGLNVSNGPGQNVIDMTNARGNPSYYIPESGYGSAIANAAKLQAAIKRAAANNHTAEQEIVLPAGAVFGGPITLPTPAGSKYITIRSGSLSSLPAGNRVGPGHGNLMPVITAPSSTTHVLAALDTTRPAPV
ncbi:MAG: YdcF family protein, partial [Pyrinomonadaceae bacterium]|nr:YdcF family protein [Pyrinomonadaceae bacterium]